MAEPSPFSDDPRQALIEAAWQLACVDPDVKPPRLALHFAECLVSAETRERRIELIYGFSGKRR